MKVNFFFEVVVLIAAGIVLAFLFQGRTNKDLVENKNDNCKYSKLSSSAIAYYHAGWKQVTVFLRSG